MQFLLFCEVKRRLNLRFTECLTVEPPNVESQHGNEPSVDVPQGYSLSFFLVKFTLVLNVEFKGGG